MSTVLGVLLDAIGVGAIAWMTLAVLRSRAEWASAKHHQRQLERDRRNLIALHDWGRKD